MTFLRYDQLPDVSAAWEAYRARCKANSAQRDAESTWKPGMTQSEYTALCAAASKAWGERHDASWAQYQRDWQAAFAAMAGEVSK